jgi:hypothetical protein
VQTKDFFDEVCHLSRTHGPDAAVVESAFISVANDVLFDAWNTIEKVGGASTIPRVHNSLELLSTIALEYTSHKAAKSILFAACRVRAMGFMR